MHVKELFPSKFVSAEDLGGRECPVEIRMIQREKVGKEEEERPVVYFAGRSKGMVLNRTNARRIAETYGQETSAWIGRTIVLYPSETDFGGETVPCIRVRIDAEAQPHMDPQQQFARPYANTQSATQPAVPQQFNQPIQTMAPQPQQPSW